VLIEVGEEWVFGGRIRERGAGETHGSVSMIWWELRG
jgi:hypothetical protein